MSTTDKIDFKNVFTAETQSITSLYGSGSYGFIVPAYQRPYRWKEENITQLFADVANGMKSLMNNPYEIHFFGTLITVQVDKDGKSTAWPATVYSIIDGQQRVMTITLLGALLYQRLWALYEKLSNYPDTKPFRSFLELRLTDLEELFSLKRGGTPSRKPIIIRASSDDWTYNDYQSKHYKSDEAKYLADIISAIYDADNNKRSNPQFPPFPLKTATGENLAILGRYLENIELVGTSGYKDETTWTFPTGWEILKKTNNIGYWDYEQYKKMYSIVANQKTKKDLYYLLSSIVQLLAFQYFLTQKCCFTHIVATKAEWAFDMFQSLNATGTPLTAIETFKPEVNEAVAKSALFVGSNTEKYFNQVEQLFRTELDENQDHTKLIDEYLTTFALAYDGKELENRFSRQLTWLKKTFRSCQTAADQEEFVYRMANHAEYYRHIEEFDVFQNCLPLLSNTPDGRLATLCILYLKESQHRMANVVLARFYSQILRNKIDAEKEFVATCKAVAAFYTLWRSVYSNQGLDSVYRRLMRLDQNKSAISWCSPTANLTSTNLKSFFTEELLKKNIDLNNNTVWLSRTYSNFRYDRARFVAKFALLISSQGTIADPNSPGLMMPGKQTFGIDYLKTEMWKSSHLKTIEHIAPQNNATGWDSKIYSDDHFHQVGNLTLLPEGINQAVGNLSWSGKWIYYKHLSEQDETERKKLKQLANQYQIKLKPSTIQKLTSAPKYSHLEPILGSIGIQGVWDLNIINNRTQRISEILWEQMKAWLQ